jgi:hypothetical protein
VPDVSSMKMKKIIVLVISILCLGCTSKEPLKKEAESIDDCFSIGDSMERDKCIANLAEKKIFEDKETSELYCGKITDGMLRDTCYYDVVQEQLILYYTSKNEEREPIKPLLDDLNRICGKIEGDLLKHTCMDRLGRPHLFRNLNENYTKD